MIYMTFILHNYWYVEVLSLSGLGDFRAVAR